MQGGFIHSKQSPRGGFLYSEKSPSEHFIQSTLKGRFLWGGIFFPGIGNFV